MMMKLILMFKSLFLQPNPLSLANKPVPDQGVSKTRRNPLSRHLHPVELHRLQKASQG